VPVSPAPPAFDAAAAALQSERAAELKAAVLAAAAAATRLQLPEDLEAVWAMLTTNPGAYDGYEFHPAMAAARWAALHALWPTTAADGARMPPVAVLASRLLGPFLPVRADVAVCVSRARRRGVLTRRVRAQTTCRACCHTFVPAFAGRVQGDDEQCYPHDFGGAWRDQEAPAISRGVRAARKRTRKRAPKP
jgi:hypothetical protein